MKISEQIAELLKKRGAHADALEELRARTEKDARVFTDEEQAACDEIIAAVKAIDAQVGRLREMEQVVARAATPVDGTPRIEGGAPAVPAGIGFVRQLRSIVLAQGNLLQAAEISRSMFRDTPQVALALSASAYHMRETLQRAAVGAATTIDPNWAGALVAQTTLSGEIIKLVDPLTIIGSLKLRKVPFNVKIPRELTMPGTAGWVGEGKPKPVGKGSYDQITVPMTKLALILVTSTELARSSDPASETLMRDGLVRSIAKQKNIEFISANAPIAGVSPGGIRNGLPAGQIFASTGNSPAEVHADLTHAVMLATTGDSSGALAWVMNTSTAAWLGGMQNAMGAALQFPSMTSGSLLGYPVVHSSAVPADLIMLLDQELILHAEDPTVEIDSSTEAAVQMDSAPTDPATGLVSFWQNNLIGFRGEQFTYWKRARDESVVVITGVGYTTWPPVAMAAAAPQSAPPTKRAA
jgi:HK97 family phage major capsid protein